MQTTQNIHVRNLVPLVAPGELVRQLPLTDRVADVVVHGRATVQALLSGADPRLLVVIGPCSIHDEAAALEYARKLAALNEQVRETLFLVMRVYFEKPRTTIGWKGLINDPALDGTFDIETGLRRGRALLLQVGELGLPTATEMLDPITPQYLADLITWGSLGARTTESQTHRQMASGLSMPIGFKNGTDGDLQTALDAMEAARHPHSFLGITEAGQTCIVNTLGNPYGHLILRGGRSGPNYDALSVAEAVTRCHKAKLNERVMVDCSHANSNKDYRKQAEVFRDVLHQKVAGNKHILGMMVESNLHAGNQPLKDIANLQYGVSITDACIDWQTTEELLLEANAALSGKALAAR
jgi:3-deoxy-7-phosphoheptulonate synthase